MTPVFWIFNPMGHYFIPQHNPIVTPFSLNLNLLTHYFHEILDLIGSKFVSRAEPGYRIFD